MRRDATREQPRLELERIFAHVEEASMSPRVRYFVVAVIGVAAALGAYALSVKQGTGAADMAWPMRAARDIVSGIDPYLKPYVDAAGNHWPTNPVTTAMPFIPFTWAPGPVVGATLVGLMSGLLGYGLTKEHKWWPLLVFCTPPYLACVLYMQWPPLIMATYYLPRLLPLALVKPSIALPVLLTRLTVKRAVACGVVVAATFALCPWWWPADWLASLSDYTGFTPMLTVPGFLVLAALLRWRDRRAWVLVIFACVPQRIFYDQLLLWLIPQNAKRILLLTVSMVTAFVVRKLTGFDTEILLVIFMYLPCTAFVLWPPREAKSARHAAKPGSS